MAILLLEMSADAFDQKTFSWKEGRLLSSAAFLVGMLGSYGHSVRIENITSISILQGQPKKLSSSLKPCQMSVKALLDLHQISDLSDREKAIDIESSLRMPS